MERLIGLYSSRRVPVLECWRATADKKPTASASTFNTWKLDRNYFWSLDCGANVIWNRKSIDLSWHSVRVEYMFCLFPKPLWCHQVTIAFFCRSGVADTRIGSGGLYRTEVTPLTDFRSPNMGRLTEFFIASYLERDGFCWSVNSAGFCFFKLISNVRSR